MRAPILQALFLLGLVVVGYRSCTLEKKLAELEHKTGKMREELPPAADATEGARPRGALEARIAALEEDLAQAEDDLATIEELVVTATEKTDGEDAKDDQRILSVVTRAHERVLERQLQFHRAHWSQFREQTLHDFSARQGLDSYQQSELQRLLEEELDSMVEILKRPDTAENPERAAADWDAELQKTDRAVERVLEPEQLEAWMSGRAFERAVLFPWLPKRSN